MVEETVSITFDLDANLHEWLLAGSAKNSRSVSDWINESLHLSFEEDKADLQAFSNRADETPISYEELVQRLKADGKL